MDLVTDHLSFEGQLAAVIVAKVVISKNSPGGCNYEIKLSFQDTYSFSSQSYSTISFYLAAGLITKSISLFNGPPGGGEWVKFALLARYSSFISGLLSCAVMVCASNRFIMERSKGLDSPGILLVLALVKIFTYRDHLNPMYVCLFSILHLKVSHLTCI